MMSTNVPILNSKYFCIGSRDEKILSAVAASYLIEEDQYLPFFEFPTTLASKPESDVDVHDVHYISITRATDFSARLFNSLQRLGKCDYVILIGLNDNQKSYLDFLDDYNIIVIETAKDAEYLLRPLSTTSGYLNCKAEEVCLGLYTASKQNATLRIDPSAATLVPVSTNWGGIIVVEDEDNLIPVIAVIYGISVKSDVQIIRPLSIGKAEIKNLVEKWKDEDDDKYFDELRAAVYSRIESIDFTKYTYATFFTSGFPYGLVIKNLIPASHVNTALRPDLFVFNNLYIYHQPHINSAVVFSPLEFGTDEETEFVIKKLQQVVYHVKPLVGKSASVYNMSNLIAEYPFEILHICSHGGEVEGTRIVEEFIDRDGDKHTVEYDEVLSFAPSRNEELIEVTFKYVFRKFDGLVWKSAELDARPYPHHVFNDMMKAITEKKVRKGTRVPVVEGSCSIKCADFIYQAMFNSLSGYHGSPFIFNNTCWSWSDIIDSFLYVGSSGYVGTLWAIDNTKAVAFAESFYQLAFGDTILNAFHQSLSTLAGSRDEHIYHFWGLHFAVFKQGNSITETRRQVAIRLLDGFYRWRDRSASTKNEKTKSQIQRLEKWISMTLQDDFPLETLALVAPPAKS